MLFPFEWQQSQLWKISILCEVTKITQAGFVLLDATYSVRLKRENVLLGLMEGHWSWVVKSRRVYSCNWLQQKYLCALFAMVTKAQGETLQSYSVGSMTAGKLPHPEVIPCQSRSASFCASLCGCDSMKLPDCRAGFTISMSLFCKICI